MADGYGILFVYVFFLIIIVFTVIGLTLLVVSLIVSLKQRKGRILFWIGLVCLIPCFLTIVDNLKQKIQEWNELGSLMQAVEMHNYRNAEKAIREGSNINEINYTAYPGSPLTYAISKKDLKMVQLLVENGADINFEPKGRGSAPLNQAIYQKNIAIVTYLLENGADVLQENEVDRNNRPIAYAIRMNAGKEIIDILKEYAEVQLDVE